MAGKDRPTGRRRPTGRGGAGRRPGDAGLRDDPTGATRQIRSRVARRRRLRLVGLLVAVLAIGLAISWFTWLRDLSVFEIRDVRVTGLDTLSSSEDQEEASALTRAVTTSLGGMTTLHVRQDELDQALARWPRVAGVDVSTEFPNGATARLDLREDGSVIGEGETAVLVATDGTLLGPVGEGSETLPRIGGEPPPDDRAALGGPRLSQAMVLGSVPIEIRPFVDRSRIGEKGIEVELTNGLLLIFGDDTKPVAKWKAATTVIADPELVGAGYVDLTVPWRPAVGS